MMQNVRQRGARGTYYVVQNVPANARHAFENRSQVWISLRTTDKVEARSKAALVLADLETRIRAAIETTRAMDEPAVTQTVRLPIHRPHAVAAIERWRKATIDADYHATINGLELPPQLLTPRQRASLQSQRFTEVETLNPLMVDALASQGVVADVAHPALEFLAAPFATAILSVEDFRQRFGLKLIDGWPEESDAQPITAIETKAHRLHPLGGRASGRIRFLDAHPRHWRQAGVGVQQIQTSVRADRRPLSRVWRRRE